MAQHRYKMTSLPYTPTSIARNWRTIQSSTNARWETLCTLRDLLAKCPRKTNFNDLGKLVRVTKDLGQGVYGKVYEVMFRSANRNAMPYAFALKRVQVNNVSKESRADIVEKIMREIQSFGFTNGLVYLRICPNFTLVPRTFFTKIPSTTSNLSLICCMIIMERESGTFREWLRMSSQHSEETVMGCILQIFMGIAALVRHLDICHNDLYFKNVLYTECQPFDLNYSLNGHCYRIRNCSMLIKISDFGIASSPKILRIDHSNLTHLVMKNLPIGNLQTFDFGHHILDYINVPPYARDPAVVLRSLSLTAHVPPNVRLWATESLAHLDMYCKKGLMHSGKYILQFIMDIFSPRFLSACNMDQHMFTPLPPHDTPDSPVPPPSSVYASAQHQHNYTSQQQSTRPSETFTICGENVGDDAQISRVLTEQVHFFHMP